MMISLTLRCMLTALWVSGCMGKRRLEYIWNTSNLFKCSSNVDYCSNVGLAEYLASSILRNPQHDVTGIVTQDFLTKHVLIGCTDQDNGLCRYRCPLGQPIMRYRPTKGKRCAAMCPSGYFVDVFGNSEVCRLHSSTCPKDQHVILPGTSWHDMICGDPDDYMSPNGLLKKIESDVFLNTLNRLAMAWVRAVPEEDIRKLCNFFSGLNHTTCIYNVEYVLTGMNMPVENIYYTLNKISSFATADLMYNTVVKPFVNREDMEPRLSIQVVQPGPLRLGEQDTIIEARLTIPLGTSHRYIPTTLKWYTGRFGDRLVVKADKNGIVSSEWRYNITRGLDWTRRVSFGFFVYTLDISLVVERFHCGLFDSVHVEVEVYDKHVGVVGLHSTVDVNCLWKPKLHPSCNCTHALLHYANPGGLCSPTCILNPFTHLSKGAEGTHNDWTLEIAHEDLDTSIRAQGRVLYGAVSPKTERFCLMTMNVFDLSPGPTRVAPSAPLDVRRCDVVLVEFDIWIGDAPGGDELYLPIAVRSLWKEDTVKRPELYIPIQAVDTLKTIIRQGWGVKIGVKVSFLHSSRNNPYQEELAAALDWILTFQSQQNRALTVVVIDVDIWTIKSTDFAMMNSLYGSKLELIPGLSADKLAHVIRTRGYNTEYMYFKCIHKEKCSRPITTFYLNKNVMYQQVFNDTIVECHSAPLSPEKCIVCSKEDMTIIICPTNHEPVEIEDSEGIRLLLQPYNPQLHNLTQSQSLQPEQEQAETLLREVGLLVSSRGAFLNLDTISVFPQSKTGCEQVRPGRWTIGEYTLEDPYAIKVPPGELYPERTGLLVFEELCRRSNNRAGIVVSIPSTDYVSDNGCRWVRLLNRHVTTDPGGWGNRVHYSMQDLYKIIFDMAKWGVCRYSLGYLDYTFGNSKGTPTFTELSHIINSAATKIRTLHYRYTRNSTFGDGGYSYAHVDGVYKLEGGMFFQHVTENIPLTKSFVPVPDMPNLRLGLSSDMNVGAPLSISELIIRDDIEKVTCIPYGAHVIDLNYKDMVAFVDQNMDRICIHSPSKAARSNNLRFPSFGIQSKEDGSDPKSCNSYISGAEHHATVLVPLPITRESRDSIIQSILKISRWLGAPVLTREEEQWLSSMTVITNRTTSTHLKDTEGLVSILDSMHLISKTVECIGGSSSCMELGDYADNSWPQGGTGYPIAISSVFVSDDEVLIKMLIRVYHGAISVKIPCDMKPFSFGSEQLLSPQPSPGIYMDTQEQLISKMRKYVTKVGTLTPLIEQPLALLYCRDMDQSPVDHPSSDMHFEKTYNCVHMMNEYIRDFKNVCNTLGSMVEANENTLELTVKRVAYISSRTSALCLCATVLALLINITLIMILCSMCKVSRYRQQRYRKLQ